MGNYLILYNGAAEGSDKSEVTDEQSADFLRAWGAWAQEHHAHIVDGGSPLFRKKRLTAQDVTDLEDSRTGYCILRADSHDEAVRIMSSHPHLRLFAGNSIDVLECPPAPS